MIVHEKNHGEKIEFQLIGSELRIRDEEMILDLSAMQEEEAVQVIVYFDRQKKLTTNSRKGRSYVLEIVIPPMEYMPSEENPEEIIPAPIDLNKVELTLWAVA